MVYLGSWLAWTSMLVLSTVVNSSPIPPADVPDPIHPNINSHLHIGIPESSMHRHSPQEVRRDPQLQGSDLLSALFSGGVLDKALKSATPGQA
ncbi:hypothetical protein PVAR5_4528 [Paecilomyces variotii No. 5]|uniref:Uncharacterized protein n=1 Tax=Byssochlamys spectabilis (strain No. 5 / NBRC 109023) TaxID=1356009 RepID=V5I0C2_BYSSN|nr:hypothetical protein PVAR5_4528 [Paecilomyces variotii No. 5]